MSGFRQRAVQNNMQRIIGHLFDTDGLQYLETMARYSPRSQKAIEATSQLVGRAIPNVLSVPAANGNNPLSGPRGTQLLPEAVN